MQSGRFTTSNTRKWTAIRIRESEYAGPDKDFPGAPYPRTRPKWWSSGVRGTAPGVLFLPFTKGDKENCLLVGPYLKNLFQDVVNALGTT